MLLRCGLLIGRRAALPAVGGARLASVTLVTRISFDGSRPLHTAIPQRQEVTPLRKELKDVSKAARAAKRVSENGSAVANREQIDGWELTVGIEIHAQLNTPRKLFSGKSTLGRR